MARDLSQPRGDPSVNSRLHRFRRPAAKLALAYAVYALLLVYVLPPLAKHLTETKLTALLQRPVTVTRIALNPFTLCLQVHGFEVWEADGETLFAGVGRVELNLDLVLSVLQRGLVVSAVTVDGPHAIVVRRQDGTFNFSDLTRPSAAPTPTPPPAPRSAPPRFSVSNIQVKGGWFFFRDEVVKAQQRLTGVELSIAAVSSLPNRSEIYVQPAFRAHLNGRELVLDSQTKPFADSQESAASLSLRNLDLTALAHYLPEPRNVDLSSGWLDINLKLDAQHVFKQRPSLSVCGEIGLREVRLTGRDGQPMAGLGALQVQILPADLMQKEVHLGRITCTAPFLRLVRDVQGALLLPQIGAAPATPPPAAPAPVVPAAGPPAPPPITADIDDIVVQDGRLEFSDDTVRPAFQTTLGLQLEVSGLTTRPERPIKVHFEAVTESAETLTGTYTVTLFPLLSVTGTTSAKDVRLPRYMPYLESALDSRITRGTLALSVEHDVALPAGAPAVVTVSNLDLAVNDFCLTAGAEQAPVVSVQELVLGAVTADLARREAVVGSFTTRGGQVKVERRKDGSLNLQRLLRAGPPPPPAAAAAGGGASATAPWTVTLRSAALSQWAVAVDDQQPRTPVHLAVDDITLDLKDLSTRAGQKGTLTLGLKLNQSAALAVAGGFSVQPLAVDLGIKLTDLAVKDFQGYLADHLQLLVSDGVVETDLKVVVGQAADAGFAGSVDGSFALRRFVSVDQAHAEDFVRAKELALRGLHVALRPLAVRLDEVALSGLDTALTIEPDGSLNLLSVLGVAPAPAAAAAPPATPPAAAPAAAAGGSSAFPLNIGTIRLDGCGIVFTDQQRTPHYRVALGELAGTVTGLSLDQPTPAQIALAGRFDGQAPFSLTATLADLGPRMTLTAATVLQDFELSPLTPYAGRYVGYTVQKGKLNFDLQYTLNQRQLVAEQKVKIDQFAFGQKVDSPDATTLPVRLAVALLKDRKGQINLDVPVRGSLDDPEFSILRIVLKIVRDLVAKAATAPFAMLGALVGGGEELSFVEFAAGRADLDEAGTRKLETLAKALLERPELQVETGGTVDPASDREALLRQAVLRQVKARRLADLVKAGTPAGSVDEVTLTADEHAAYLLTLYRETLAPPAAAPPPAGQAAPAAPPLPAPAEIEQQLMARTTVTDEEVNLLAGQRAARVREFLTTTGQIAPDRVFVVAAAPPAAGGASATAASARQARLSLR